MHIVSLIVCYVIMAVVFAMLMRLDKKCRQEAEREKELSSWYGENNDESTLNPRSNSGVYTENFVNVKGLDY